MVSLSILIGIVILICASLLLKPILSSTKFINVDGPIQLSKSERVAKHIGSNSVSGSFRVNQMYSEDVHNVQLHLEKVSSPNTFIGIINSDTKQLTSASHGWLISKKQIIPFKPIDLNIIQIFRK